VLSSIIDSHAALGALGRFNGLGSNPKPPNPKIIVLLKFNKKVLIFNFKKKKIMKSPQVLRYTVNKRIV